MADERDPKISQRYRDVSGEEPSRELDQAILAAAHRSVDRPHAPLVVPAGRHRWYYSLGAAAVLALAIAVTIHVERQQPDAELAEAPRPAAAPEPQQDRPSSAPTAPAAEPSRDMAARKERRQVYTPERAPAAPAAPAPAAPASAESTQPSAGAMADSQGARRDAEAKVREEQAKQNVEAMKKERAAAESARAPAAAASRAAPAPMASQYAAVTPERELERIADLRRQGRDEEADKALAEFRKRYPDYQIPQAMLEKVERRPAR